MARSPRPVSAPVLNRTQWVHVVASGFLMAVLALLARVIGEDSYDAAVGATMLLVALSLLHLVTALSVRDEVGTIFSRATLPGWPQLRLYGLTLLLILLVTEIGVLQRIVGTVSLSGRQWLISIGLALVLLVFEEAVKFVLRRRMPAVGSSTQAEPQLG